MVKTAKCRQKCPITGIPRLVSRDWYPETGYWRLVTGDWLPETGYWGLVTRDWLPETGYPIQEPDTGARYRSPLQRPSYSSNEEPLAVLVAGVLLRAVAGSRPLGVHCAYSTPRISLVHLKTVICTCS